LPLIFEALDHQTPIDVIAAKNDRSVVAIDYREIKLAVKLACGLHQGTAGLCDGAYESIYETF
jgi:hypothetical protein